jgi:protein TonB
MSRPWSVTARVPPVYPMSARRRGVEGDVSLRVDLSADGRPRAVSVQHGSGDAQLDAAAIRAVAQWRFAVAAPTTIEIPVHFRLNANTAEATQP